MSFNVLQLLRKTDHLLLFIGIWIRSQKQSKNRKCSKSYTANNILEEAVPNIYQNATREQNTYCFSAYVTEIVKKIKELRFEALVKYSEKPFTFETYFSHVEAMRVFFVPHRAELLRR